MSARTPHSITDINAKLGLLFCLLGFIPLNLHSQSSLGTINGQVLDEQKKAAEFSTVLLLKASDSTMVKGAACDVAGNYEFVNVNEGTYIVAATMVGYKKIYSSLFTIDAAHKTYKLPSIELIADTKSLNEVVITAQKPFIEQMADKMVINVENSVVASGGTALEVLEKAPGVIIDKDEKITLSGKQGVIIMIDGKRTFLSNTEVSNMLKNMSADGLEQIEIITNPSAKFDAAGNAGIINIKTKKNKNLGTNGKVTLSAGQGKFFKYNSNTSLNHRNEKFNVFGNYDHRKHTGWGSHRVNRIVNFNEETTVFDQYDYETNSSLNNSAKIGLDYYINKKNTVGFIGNGYLNNGNSQGRNTANIENGNDEVDSSFDLYRHRDNRWRNMSYNVNYRKTFDSAERELTADIDYSVYKNMSADDIKTLYYDRTGAEMGIPLIINNASSSTINIKSFKADYIHPLSKGEKFETGIKSSYVITDNDFQFKSMINEVWLLDAGKTNHFRYTENINAAYINYSKQLNKIGIQLGLRGEQTISKGNSVTLNKIVKRNYTNIFPSVFVSQKMGKDHQLGYSYSRRIDRPRYDNLNPFIFFIDQYTYFQGNPFLKPNFSNSFQLTHTFKGRFITSLSYSHTKNVATELTEQNDTTKVTRIYVENLNSHSNYNLNINIPIEIAKWWNANNNISVFYNQYKSKVGGGGFNYSRYSVNFNSNHTITLPNNFKIEFSGFYNSPGLYSIFKYKSNYGINAGIQKSFMKKKANIKVNCNDIFNTMKWHGKVDYQNMDIDIFNKWESRQVRITLTYNFGNQLVKSERKRSSGAEAEKSRIKTE